MDINQAVADLEDENQIRFPDSKTRAEFIEDCIAVERWKTEMYDRDPAYRPDWRMIILDNARWYGYSMEEV